MGGHLRGILAGIKWPNEPEYHLMQAKLEAALDTGSRGTLVSDILSWASSVEASASDNVPVTTLNGTEYDAFLQRMNADADIPYVPWDAAVGPNPNLGNRIKEIRSIKVSGIEFSNVLTSKHKGDGYILFKSKAPSSSYLPNHPTPTLAGRIEKIFLHSHLAPGQEKPVTEPYLVIREYESLTKDHIALDPFSRIPHLEAKLCYDTFKKRPHVIKATDLVSHFASFIYTPEDIGRDCIVVLSLDRVRFSL